MRNLPILIAVLLAATSSFSQNKGKEAPPKYAASVPKPTESEVRYGEHERNVLDFWKAESDEPTPVAFVIHGGGWTGGSKERLDRFVDPIALLEAGISVVSINYRLIQRNDSDTDPPVKAPLHDAARALQFVRSKAEEWGLDKTRIGAAGGSAGACSSLWLAFHDDLADPDSEDPVARESTRLQCAAVTGAQTTLDPRQMVEWTPNSRYGGHAFGIARFPEFLEKRDEIAEWIAEYSPYANVTVDDPPVFLTYGAPPALGQEQKDPTHTSNFGVKLQEHCAAIGVECVLSAPGLPETDYASPTDFLIARLKDGSTGSDEGFVSLFNGENLDGWDGDPKLWKVENGIVVGTCEGPEHFPHNTFLIWRGGTVKDFELRATMRVIGDNNSGIQYRSRPLPEAGEWGITGYQCDVHPAPEHTAMTYEEKGRGIFGLNGKNVLVDPEGARWLLSEHEPVIVDTSEWQEYTVIARGNRLVHQVAGKLTSELIDHDEKGRALEGLLAIQLHRGNAHRVEIKSLEWKALEAVDPEPFDPKVLEEAEPIDKPRTNRPQGTAVNSDPKRDAREAADAEQDRSVVIFDGKKPDSLACDTTLRKMPDGSWVMIMLGGGHTEPLPANRVFLTRSHDEGRTWSPMEPIDLGVKSKNPDTALVPTELMVRGDRCTMFVSTHDGTFADWKAWMVHSDDSCRTWGTLEPVPGRLHHRTFVRNVIETQDGRLLLPFQHYLRVGETRETRDGRRFSPPTDPRNGVLMSEDGGMTWTEHGDIRLVREDDYHGWAENNVVELSDGRIAMVIRADGKKVLYTAISADGGRTWPEVAEPGTIPNPGSKATIYGLGGDKVALLHNPNPSHRSPLALWVSFDGMKTWPYQRVLVSESADGPKGRLNYPDGFVSADGNWLHFAFDDNRHRAIYYGARLPTGD